VLITSHRSPGGLASAEVAARFNSPAAKWKDGSVIRIVLRPKSDSDTPVLGGMFPGMADAIEQARERPDVPVAATDQDNADLVERAPGSLAGSTFTQIKMEKRNLRFVAIDGVEPSPETLESGAYPYSKTFYFVLPEKKNALAEQFIAFLQTPAGHAALRETGNLPAAD
jgi:phosphate transport system substrate-binding protein